MRAYLSLDATSGYPQRVSEIFFCSFAFTLTRRPLFDKRRPHDSYWYVIYACCDSSCPRRIPNSSFGLWPPTLPTPNLSVPTVPTTARVVLVKSKSEASSLCCCSPPFSSCPHAITRARESPSPLKSPLKRRPSRPLSPASPSAAIAVLYTLYRLDCRLGVFRTGSCSHSPRAGGASSTAGCSWYCLGCCCSSSCGHCFRTGWSVDRSLFSSSLRQ